MVTLIREIMSKEPIICRGDETVAQAAERMRDQDVGNVLVQDNGGYGIVTDRDIVVRAIATHRDVETTQLRDIMTPNLCTMKGDAPVDEAVKLMREWGVRRVAVMDDVVPIGVISLGDLAIERDPDSALADISAAPAQH